MTQTFVVLADDAPGVLNRVVSLLRRRAVNIASMSVGPTDRPAVSRMTLTVEAGAEQARHLALQLRKLVPVRSVTNITAAPKVLRDLALIKVRATQETRLHILELVDTFRARVVDVGAESLIIEATGIAAKIDRFVDVLRPFGVLEVGRAGAVAVLRDPVAADDSRDAEPCATCATSPTL